MPSGRGMESARALSGSSTRAKTTFSATWPALRRNFLTVGLIYTRRGISKLLISKEFREVAAPYVATHPGTCVEDLDSRSLTDDVTYCPKWRFATGEAPVDVIRQPHGGQIPLAQRLLSSLASGSTKTA